MICRICGSDKITNSHRRGMEKLFKYFYPRAPYRCKECWSRFWVFENPFKTTLSKLIAGLAVCMLIFLLSWPFLPFNKTEPVQVKKKDTSGSLFVTKRPQKPKPVTEPEKPKQPQDIAPQPEMPVIPEDIEPSIPDSSSLDIQPSPKTDTAEPKPKDDIAGTTRETAMEKDAAGDPEIKSKPEETTTLYVTKPEISPTKPPAVKHKTVPEKDRKPEFENRFKGVKISESKGMVSILLKTDKIITKHKHFFITNPKPPRIVVDLPGKWKHRGDTTFNAKGDIISRVRVGQHPDFFRIVLDMKTKKQIFPSYKESPEGLIISVKK